MKKNLLFLSTKDGSPSITNSYKKNIDYLMKKYNVTPYILSIENGKKLTQDKQKIKENLEKVGYIFKTFLNKDELFKFAEKLEGYKQVYTYKEELIPLSIELKNFLGQKVTENKKLFVSKKLQRKLLLEYNKDITISYKEFASIEEINIKEILSKFSFPFIIKPSTGIASGGVYKINSKMEFVQVLSKIGKIIKKISKSMNIRKNEIIIEEFIDGKMYTIDYFVDENQQTYITKPVRTFTLNDEYGIDDFGITKEILGEKIEKDFENINLTKFIEDNVKACGIRNNFVHHEFKITSNGQLKTIELNGRIGGFRRKMYNLAYDLIVLEYLFNKNIKPKFKQYYMFVGLFPTKEINKTYLGLKEEFLNKIISLSSFYDLELREAYIGNRIGFTKNGYKFFGTLELINKNYEQIEKDYQFIKKNLQQNIIYQ